MMPARVEPCFATWRNISPGRPSSFSPTVVSEAWLLGALGEIDAAFEVLERAEEECQANLYFTGLPVFDPLRGDPRFTALLQRLGLPPEGRS